MSNIEPNIIDPAKKPPTSPDIVPEPDVIREPGTEDVPPVEPDPEERRGPQPDDIERAAGPN